MSCWFTELCSRYLPYWGFLRKKMQVRIYFSAWRESFLAPSCAVNHWRPRYSRYIIKGSKKTWYFTATDLASQIFKVKISCVPDARFKLFIWRVCGFQVQFKVNSLRLIGPFAPCNGIQESLGFWILDSTQWIPDFRYWIPDSLSVGLRFRFQSWDSRFRIPKPRAQLCEGRLAVSFSCAQKHFLG